MTGKSRACVLPLITLFASLLDLKAIGPLYHWVTSKETGRTGPASQLTASDGLSVISTMFRGLPWGSEGCSHSAKRNYPDTSLIIVKPNFGEEEENELTLNNIKGIYCFIGFGFFGKTPTASFTFLCLGKNITDIFINWYIRLWNKWITFEVRGLLSGLPLKKLIEWKKNHFVLLTVCYLFYVCFYTEII